MKILGKHRALACYVMLTVEYKRTFHLPPESIYTSNNPDKRIYTLLERLSLR